MTIHRMTDGYGSRATIAGTATNTSGFMAIGRSPRIQAPSGSPITGIGTETAGFWSKATGGSRRSTIEERKSGARMPRFSACKLKNAMAKRKPSRKPLTDADGEVRELTTADAAEARPFSALPAAEQKVLLSLRKRGRKKPPRPRLGRNKAAGAR